MNTQSLGASASIIDFPNPCITQHAVPRGRRPQGVISLRAERLRRQADAQCRAAAAEVPAPSRSEIIDQVVRRSVYEVFEKLGLRYE